VRQPPAYSPLPWRALRESARGVLRRESRDRVTLRTLLAREFSADAVGLFGSGTQALQIALGDAACATGSDIVALPAFTCFDVASAAVGAGLRIVLYDVDPATLSPDCDSLRAALAQGARIVVVTPLFGFPIDWEAVQACAVPHGAVLIEDAAQGLGATWHGARLGTLGDRSVLSFGRGKGWTGGQGGALLTRRGARPPDLRNGKHLAADLRVLTLAAAQWAFGRPNLYGIPAALPWLGLGETRYHDPTPPKALPHTAARLLLHAVAASQREIEARKIRAVRLLAKISGGSRLRPIKPLAGAQPGYLRLPVRVAGGVAGLADPDRARRLGVARSYPTPLSEVPAVRERLVAMGSGAWPGAEELARDLVTLPTHSLLSVLHLDQVARAVA